VALSLFRYSKNSESGEMTSVEVSPFSERS
jgi:hypothetical protein